MRIVRNQRGDTLVEVLLAISIIGLIVGISYASASRSLLATQAAHEQIEAAKIAESQIESIKHLAVTAATGSPNDVFALPAGTPFCTQGIAITPSCNTGIYTIQVTPTESSFTLGANTIRARTFTARITWERIGTGTPAESSMAYTLFRR